MTRNSEPRYSEPNGGLALLDSWLAADTGRDATPRHARWSVQDELRTEDFRRRIPKWLRDWARERRHARYENLDYYWNITWAEWKQTSRIYQTFQKLTGRGTWAQVRGFSVDREADGSLNMRHYAGTGARVVEVEAPIDVPVAATTTPRVETANSRSAPTHRTADVAFDSGLN